ncbi:UNVERIFIED_CONTAM: LYR motif-containing protein [Sesamum radiatum]|uniref:LYR motif-containing protein n=1 Tax=Sesamum radiatum TaxID=300843 RepID=A0AAW2RWQ2_SESRA
MVYREMHKALRAYGEVLRLVRRLPQDTRAYYAKYARENFVNYRDVDPNDAAALNELLNRTYTHSLWVLNKYSLDESVAEKKKKKESSHEKPHLRFLSAANSNTFSVHIRDRKNVQVVKLFIHQFDGAEAITYGEMINVSAIYLAGYKGNLKWEFTSLLHHEMTHVFQWNGEGHTPVGLVEGIADYMILKSGYYPPGFAKPGQGERWDQGYDFTARFLEYCDGLKPGFVAELNKMMRHNYSEDFGVDREAGRPALG